MNIVKLVCVAAFITIVGNFRVLVTGQQTVAVAGNLPALCTMFALAGFVTERLRCDNKKDKDRDEFFQTLCRKRFFNSLQTCLRCIARGKDRVACNADIGSNGMDDAPADANNDDCVFDENLQNCVDEGEP